MLLLRTHFFVIMMGVACCSQAGCAALGDANKAPHAVLENLAVDEAQDLIVELDDSAIQAQALQMNKDRGILFDDNETLRFKTERYSAMKAAVMATLPSGKVEVVKNYDALPLMFLRFRSAEALKVLLAHRAVVRVYADKMAMQLFFCKFRFLVLDCCDFAAIRVS